MMPSYFQTAMWFFCHLVYNQSIALIILHLMSLSPFQFGNWYGRKMHFCNFEFLFLFNYFRVISLSVIHLLAFPRVAGYVHWWFVSPKPTSYSFNPEMSREVVLIFHVCWSWSCPNFHIQILFLRLLLFLRDALGIGLSLHQSFHIVTRISSSVGTFVFKVAD